VDYWQHVMASSLAPYRIDTTDCDLRSEIRHVTSGRSPS
jgi:hypothetical protein